jgi:hypothetical protein
MNQDPTQRFALVAATILIVVGVTLAVAAHAESTLGPMPAPVGHRQPRAQDLPPKVLREEGMVRPPAEPQGETTAQRINGSQDTGKPPAGPSTLDKELQICRGC